jgi:hypothetical protein
LRTAVLAFAEGREVRIPSMISGDRVALVGTSKVTVEGSVYGSDIVVTAPEILITGHMDVSGRAPLNAVLGQGTTVGGTPTGGSHAGGGAVAVTALF